MLIPPHVQEVIDRLVRDPSVRAIWLVGSRANSEFHEKSDWDLLVFDSEEKELSAWLHLELM